MKNLRNKFLLIATEKRKIIMRCFFIFLSAVFFSFQSFSQIIKRQGMDETGIDSRKINAHVRPNIFADLAFLEPEMKANKIEFIDHIYYFVMFGTSFQIRQVDSNMMELKGNGSSVLMSADISNHTIYYDKSILKRKLEERLKWIPYQASEPKVIPVKHLSPGSRKDYYTAFELHEISQTQWQWTNATDSVLEIPSYTYYELALNDDRILFVYEIKNISGKTEYYLQNASYITATDADGVQYILLDVDCNGSYTDPKDKILLYSWNPYSKQSGYKKIKFAKENTWYDQDYFYQEYLIKMNYRDGKFSVDPANQIFEGNSKTGWIQFSKVPKKAVLVINGKEYPAHRGKNKFECESGIYKVTISCKGFMDFETIFTVDGSSTKQEIRYEKSLPAGAVKINHIFSGDYFVTVKNINGYSRTYRNTPELNVPIGNNELTIYTDGFTTVHSFFVKEKELHEFDFEAELKKMKK